MTRLDVYEDRTWRWCWLLRDDNDQVMLRGAGFPTHSLAVTDANNALDTIENREREREPS